ncbi:TonB-dependent receptor [Desulfatiferula olefinivorans]
MKRISASIIVIILCIATISQAGEALRPGRKDLANETKQTTPEHLPLISGRVAEKGTRNRLAHIRIFVKDKASGAMVSSVTTDGEGNFSVPVCPGDYTLIIAAMGYDTFDQSVSVADRDIEGLMLRIVPRTINPYRVVVRNKKQTSEVSSQTISIQEAVAIPGSNRDVLKSVTNMPGVNAVSVFNGYGNGIVIRGSSQEDSLFTVNGHEIPAFYHFGGLESIIEPEMIESVDYNAGGFSSEYGNAMGGVISMNIRNPRTDRIGGYINLGLLSSSFMIEGPVSDTDSFYFGMKRGFLDQYLKAAERVEKERNPDNDLDFIKYPVYYDASFMYSHKASPGNEFRLIGINAVDSFKVTEPEIPVSERYSDTLNHKQWFSTLIGEWRFKNGTFNSVLSPMFTESRFTWEQGERAYHRQSVSNFSLNENAEYRLNDTHHLKAGFRMDYAGVNLDSCTLVLDKEGEISYDNTDLELTLDKDFNFFTPSVYAMDRMRFGKLTVTPGVHCFRDTYNHHSVIDPRLSLKYQLTDRTALKTAGGLYSQMPQYDEFLEPWGTRGLKPERSTHTVAGIEHAFTPDLFLDIQGYYKRFDDLVVRDRADDPTFYTNDGSGRSYGAEILLRRSMNDRFFGWIAYSYSVAKRTDGPGKPERYFDSDIPHNLVGVMSYKPNRYWSFGLKYQYVSGTPYTDLLHVDTRYDVDNNEYIPLYTGPVNDRRFRSHHQVDFRIDRYWLFNECVISTYIDIRNVFQNKYVTGITYNEDYTAKEEEVSVDSEIPLIFLGMKVDF